MFKSSKKSVAPKEPVKNVVITSINDDENTDDNLKQIAFSQQQLSQVKQSLGAIIDSMEQNKSLFSRAAQFWGERPLWQKILGGIVLSVPTLATGLAAHLAILLAISGITVVAYTTSSIILDDHNLTNKSIAQHLKEGIFSLADVLEITISALDNIRQKLAIEINRFKKQNQKLAENIESLGIQIDSLSSQVDVLKVTEKLLRQTKNDLETTAQQLKERFSEHDQLLRANQKELIHVRQDHEKSRMQLAEKITELNNVRLAMGLEIEKAKKIAATLQGTIQTLSGTVIDDGLQRQLFQEKLTNFLIDSEASFDKVADRICDAERELALVKQELQHSNERYQALLNRQEEQVSRLERLDRQTIAEKLPVAETMSNLLSQQGFYATHRQSACIPASILSSDTVAVKPIQCCS